MAQYDAVENRSGHFEQDIPFFLDLQSDFIEHTRTRVVVPLRLTERAEPFSKRLNPSFEVSGTDVTMMTLEVTSLSSTAFGPVRGSLADHRDEIIAAIDFLISGL